MHHKFRVEPFEGLMANAKPNNYHTMTADEMKQAVYNIIRGEKKVVEPKLRLSGKRRGFPMSTKTKR